MLLGIVKWFYDNTANSKTTKDQNRLHTANVTRI
jgi:hypothetical protein